MRKIEVYGTVPPFSASGEESNTHDTATMQSCPFCGSAAITCRNTHQPYYWVECGDCETRGPRTQLPARATGCRTIASTAKAHDAAMTLAIEAWNKRAEMPAELTLVA